MAKDLGIDGGVIVSGSFQGFDQDYLIHALKSLKRTLCSYNSTTCRNV